MPTVPRRMHVLNTAHTPPLSPQVASRAYVSWFGFKGGDQQKKVAYMLGQ